MKIAKTLIGSALAAALAVTTLAAPASALTPVPAGSHPIVIDTGALPKQLNIPKERLEYRPLPVNFSGGSSDYAEYAPLYRYDFTLTRGSKKIIVNRVIGAGSLAPGNSAFEVGLSPYTTDAGNWNYSVTISDYNGNSATATGSIFIKATNPDLRLTSAYGRLKKGAKITVNGTTSRHAIGKKVTIYYRAAKSKKYKKVGTTKIKGKGTSLGRINFKSKKIRIGKVYVKLKGSKNLKGGKSNTLNIKRVR